MVPTWGPMILAVVLTINNFKVMLYIIVVIWLIFIFSFFFGLESGTMNPDFNSLPQSFFTLFRTSITNEYKVVNFENGRTMQYIFYVTFVILAILLVNVLIGITANVN